MIRNWKKIRTCAVLAGWLSVAAAGLWHNYAQADALQSLQELEPEPPLSAPVMLPVTGLGGTKATLPMQAGRPYMLHFWATWCTPCREELPRLAAFLDKNPDLPVIPVALDSGLPEQVQATLPRLHAEGLPVWTAARQNVEPFLKSLQEPGLPMTLLIDAQGQVRAISDGGVDWKETGAAGTVRSLLHQVE
ncbi:TlpA family protein disulfide reductase [Bombella sp. TMW 2.2559]|uniref:TlpA family protein disulfide reductase n=1 Tax=Bombella dulcis TaxID=2967339 RepID=A0ABT3WDI6_9PROT|nr:TlpA disulfide reductase family protein [Bombella dulcis]MCX5615854.1 TlpA family protein disulfide reductase [Bombella dulcis]